MGTEEDRETDEGTDREMGVMVRETNTLTETER